jgi:hypothetical protein
LQSEPELHLVAVTALAQLKCCGSGSATLITSHHYPMIFYWNGYIFSFFLLKKKKKRFFILFFTDLAEMKRLHHFFLYKAGPNVTVTSFFLFLNVG